MDVKQVIREYLLAQELAHPTEAGRVNVEFDGTYYVISGIGPPKYKSEYEILSTTYSFSERAAKRLRSKVEEFDYKRE